MLKELVEKYGVDYNAVRKMSASETIDFLVSQGNNRFEVAFDFYKILGWSDRMAVIKTQNFVAGGFLL